MPTPDKDTNRQEMFEIAVLLKTALKFCTRGNKLAAIAVLEEARAVLVQSYTKDKYGS